MLSYTILILNATQGDFREVEMIPREEKKLSIIELHH